MNDGDLLTFWAKAQPRVDCASGSAFHPIVFHAFDVAAVGKIWLERDLRLAERLAKLLRIDTPSLCRLMTALLALHDVGKFAAAFQIKVAECFPGTVFSSGDPKLLPARFKHDEGGWSLCRGSHGRSLFPMWTEDQQRAMRPLLRAVTGHHGTPPEKLDALKDLFWPEGLEAAQRFCSLVGGIIGWPENLPTERAANRASTLVAGFGVACDWLGSNQSFFPYTSPHIDITEYWARAQKRAAGALQTAGLLSAQPAPPVSLQKLLDQDESAADPRPLQRWAETVELPAGPLLILLEDETGSGKTEAALILASRLMARGDAGGVYIALPTMATANALFERLARCYRQLFSPDTDPSLALVHGRSQLRDALFRTLSMDESGTDEAYGDEVSASATCSAWLRDDRRKAFLAEVGVGTIDQAVLAILPTRFQALRMFGLSQRVLILDEVHAYDAFVSQELEGLIKWQTSRGGSCILLSATLPNRTRHRLLKVFDRNARAEDCDAYPLATLASASQVVSTAIDGYVERARRLLIRFLPDPDAALTAIDEEARRGQAVAYIRNTVDDAIEAHAALCGRGVDARLFHARMALVDRFRIEAEVVKSFGKTSAPAERAGKVLIATQVIEQSLDIDFDAMVTDLAPVDLLIQRAGRLWRHQRPERPGEPELQVLSPAPDPKADEDWYARAFPRARWVYRDHGRLWLTAEALQRTGVIESPGGIRALVEAVYGEEAEERIPQALCPSRREAEGTASAQRGLAGGQVLDPKVGFERAGPWDDDLRPQTRLQERERKTLRLARAMRDGQIVPYAESSGLTPSQAWTLSEVQVTARRASGEVIPPELLEAANTVKAEWGRYDADKLLTILTPDDVGGAYEGRVLNHQGKVCRIVYSEDIGLVFLLA